MNELEDLIWGKFLIAHATLNAAHLASPKNAIAILNNEAKS